MHLFARFTLFPALCFYSFQCFALGLGNLDIRSKFGEPLNAVVDVYGVNERVFEETGATEFEIISGQFIGGAQDVRAVTVRLTPLEDTTATAMTLLQNTQSSFVVSDGQPKVVLSSQELCRDLILEFRLTLTYDNQTVTRDYAAIVNMPTSRPVPSISESPTPRPATVTAQRSQRSERLPIARTEQFAWDGNPRARPVQPGETLYEIALDVQQSQGGNINDIMAAIVAANPDAFINQNPDRIKAGAMINVAPTTLASAPSLVATPTKKVTKLASDYGPVQAGETLYQIAEQHRQQYDGSVMEMVDEIFALNPDAFINNDINLLKQDVMLQLPVSDELAQTTAPSSQTGEQGLQILSGDEDQDQTQTERELTDSLITIEDMTRENAELQEQVSQGNRTITLLQEELKKNNQQITALREELDALKGSPDEAASTRNETGTASDDEDDYAILDTEETEVAQGGMESTTANALTSAVSVKNLLLAVLLILLVAIVVTAFFLVKMNRNQKQIREQLKQKQADDDALLTRIKQKVSSAPKNTEESSSGLEVKEPWHE